MNAPETWTVAAVNLPEHADNPIHTDAGAHAAGFPAALVAGTTTYVYLTRPLVEAWGETWLRRGGGEVRFRAPVFDRADVQCVPTATADGVRVDAVCPAEVRNPRAVFDAVLDAGPPPSLRPGKRLADRQFTLGDDISATYASRAGDDLALYADTDIMHPSAWPVIANRVFASDLVHGSWVHTRSIIRHHGIGRVGDVVDVSAVEVDRFDRGGVRAVVDISISCNGTPLATIEHEAIVEVPDA